MTEQLTIVTWLWKPFSSWSEQAGYAPRRVKTLQRMLETHVHRPFRFVCITDQPEALDCETIRIWSSPPVSIPRTRPNCYRRLYAFSEEFRDVINAESFVSIDLDVIILDDITSLFETDADFKIVKGRSAPYNGSMWLLRVGSRSRVWTGFDPKISPRLTYEQIMANGKRYFGSDQAWISYVLRDEQTWSEADGIYNYMRDFWSRKGKDRLRLPANCRMVFFSGSLKPWHQKMSVLHETFYRVYRQFNV